MTRARLGLLISDIDGTLVRSDKTLSDATVAAVSRLTAAGMPMTLISARPPSGLHWIIDRLGLPGPFGAFNGGTVFARGGAVLQRHGLSPDVARTVLGLLIDAGVTCWVFADGAWIASTGDSPYTSREVKTADVQPIITTDFGPWIDRVDKIVGVSDDHDVLVRLEREAIAHLGAGATIARSQSYYLDFTAALANKGDGVTFLADAFHVAVDKVAVIGDQANDLPMFARAGFAIAMGQGPPEVRSRADAVTASNDEDGVAQAIDTLIIPCI